MPRLREGAEKLERIRVEARRTQHLIDSFDLDKNGYINAFEEARLRKIFDNPREAEVLITRMRKAGVKFESDPGPSKGSPVASITTPAQPIPPTMASTGFGIAKNISNDEIALSFQTAQAGMQPAKTSANINESNFGKLRPGNAKIAQHIAARDALLNH